MSRSYGLPRRLAWLLGAGLLCFLLGLLMGLAPLGVAAAESSDMRLMTQPAGVLAPVVAAGDASALPVCARVPAHDLCLDAEPGDPTDPEALPDGRQLRPASYASVGHATFPPLAQATLPPLLRPPRSQG